MEVGLYCAYEKTPENEKNLLPLKKDLVNKRQFNFADIVCVTVPTNDEKLIRGLYIFSFLYLFKFESLILKQVNFKIELFTSDEMNHTFEGSPLIVTIIIRGETTMMKMMN